MTVRFVPKEEPYDSWYWLGECPYGLPRKGDQVIHDDRLYRVYQVKWWTAAHVELTVVEDNESENQESKD